MIPALTPRELELLALMGWGKTMDEAATELGISRQTVKNLLGKAYAKLGARGRADAWRHLGWLRVPTREEARAMGVDRRLER